MHERSSSPDRVAEKHRVSMPGIAGEVFHDLWEDTVSLQAAWEIYSDLYGASEARIDLLDEVSSAFFIMVRKSLLQQIYLTLARFTDPPYSGRDRSQHNVSLERLVFEIHEGGDAEFATELEKHVKEIVAACAPVRNVRHKLFAHTDLHIALQKQPRPPGIKSGDFEVALKRLRETMNLVEEKYCDSVTIFDRTIASIAVEALYVYLEKAKKAFAAECEL